MGVRATFQVELAGQVGADGLRRGLETKGRGSRREVGWELRLIAFGLLGNVLLLGDQVVNAFLVLNHL